MWRAIQASDRRSVSRAKRMPAAKAKRRRIARSMALPHGLPADERLLSLGRSGPGVRSGLLETPRTPAGLCYGNVKDVVDWVKSNKH